MILCNRSATYLALKRYVPASFDALLASKANPDNWKAHWRHGVSILHMAKKKFRSKQAIQAFEGCLKCSTLPDNKRAEITSELAKAKARLEQQDAEVRACLCVLLLLPTLTLTLTGALPVLCCYCIFLSAAVDPNAGYEQLRPFVNAPLFSPCRSLCTVYHSLSVTL